MLSRSVPFYKEVLSLTSSLVDKYTNEGDTVVDFGCSTASTIIEIAKRNNNLELIGIDSSFAMIKRANAKLGAFGIKANLLCKDFFDVELQDVKCVISNYTIQFVEPKKRNELLKKIYDSLQDDGIFIFSEKIIYKDEQLNNFLIDEYYDLKRRNGYSDLEIAHKKEALESVLIPFSEEGNKKMILDVRFRKIETIFKWGNFTTFIAFK